MRSKPFSHVAQYPFGLITARLNHLYCQSSDGLLDRLILGLGVTMFGILFDQDKV